MSKPDSGRSEAEQKLFAVAVELVEAKQFNRIVTNFNGRVVGVTGRVSGDGIEFEDMAGNLKPPVTPAFEEPPIPVVLAVGNDEGALTRPAFEEPPIPSAAAPGSRDDAAHALSAFEEPLGPPVPPPDLKLDTSPGPVLRPGGPKLK